MKKHLAFFILQCKKLKIQLVQLLKYYAKMIFYDIIIFKNIKSYFYKRSKIL